MEFLLKIQNSYVFQKIKVRFIEKMIKRGNKKS